MKYLVLIAFTFIVHIVSYAKSNEETTFADRFKQNQCTTFNVTKGDGEGKLRYCDNGNEQLVYLSGELDSGDDSNTLDLRAIEHVIQRMKKREVGEFFVVTRDSGGGEVEWHQKLIMAVEDHCLKECRIRTEIQGSCISACNQLHITCALGATSKIAKSSKMCEHATTGDENNKNCRKCDPNPPYKCNICGPNESVDEYTSRCGRLLFRFGKRRPVVIDPEMKNAIKTHALNLAKKGIFDTEKLTCIQPTWVKTMD